MKGRTRPSQPSGGGTREEETAEKTLARFQDRFQALEREVGYLREEIVEKPESESEWRNVPSYRAYAVLTLCRILYSFRKGTIVSKPRAATWAIKYLSKEWSDIILQALATNDEGRTAGIALLRIEQFIEFVEAELHPFK